MNTVNSDVLLSSLYFAYYVVGKYVLSDAAIGSLNGTSVRRDFLFSPQCKTVGLRVFFAFHLEEMTNYIKTKT